MYSDALQIMDKNTERYMIDELKEQISQQAVELSQKDVTISQKDAEIQRLLAKLAQFEDSKE